MLKIDAGAYRVFIGDREVYLTPKEFKMARIFAENAGRLVTRRDLGSEVWGYEPGRTLDMHMTTLRRKLDGVVIRTLRGVGFRLDSPAEIVN